MNIDQLRDGFPDENACRDFFESVTWPDGRQCPHCGNLKSYDLRSTCVGPGTYECGQCKRQFRVTTKTPMDSTKLPLWKWLQAMYYIVNSSKGVFSVFLAKWIGVSQPTAWKMGHAIREMMSPVSKGRPPLDGIVEIDEKYFGGKPRYKPGVIHKGGRGTSKQCILIGVERQGSVRTQPAQNDSIANLSLVAKRYINKDAQLMSDQHHSYRHIAKDYAVHSTVNHLRKEYVRGDVHTNTAESSGSLLERAKLGVFHYMSRNHLSRYLNQIGFRWDHRIPEHRIAK